MAFEETRRNFRRKGQRRVNSPAKKLPTPALSGAGLLLAASAAFDFKVCVYDIVA